MLFSSCFESYCWSSFEYKKLVRELSKKVQKLSEAEKFVFIFEQSAQLFVKFSTKYLQHNSNQLRREIQIKTCFTQLPYSLDALSSSLTNSAQAVRRRRNPETSRNIVFLRKYTIITYFVIEKKKDKCICPLICHQYVLHTNEFIFFETITVHVHGLLCGEIQISEEFEYKHYRGAIKGFSGFQNKFDYRHRKCTRKNIFM